MSNQIATKDSIMSILQEMTQEIKPIYGDTLIAVILYGSFARGDNNEDSDVDIAILVDATEEAMRYYNDKVLDVTSEYGLNHGLAISPIDTNWDEYKKWKDILPYYQNIAKEGIILYGREARQVR
jgi:predicted nucleotidyltransferase